MNFWKYLREFLVMFPEWKEMFISYKDLKKQLKLTYPNTDDDDRPNKRLRLSDDDDGQHLDNMRKDFLKRLNAEIEKINGFFMDKEETIIMELKHLKTEVDSVNDTRQELMKLGRKMVDIHGEMILLKNYSALNYLGLLKILKKYDKRSGDKILLPFIRKVLKQPFFRTEVINGLVEDCEILICRVFSMYEQLVSDVSSYGDHVASENELGGVPSEVEGSERVESQYVRLSRSALQTLRQIRSRSSTENIFSLPPMEV